MGMKFSAPWRSNTNNVQYQTLDAVYIDKENVRWYWRLIAQVAIFMILGGYLILPTTFDSDQQLRFNKSVLAILIVALLTGGYSLTALVWFACPSILFRRDSIFIPVFSVSIFAFLCVTYALAASPRYQFSNVAAPITLALIVATASIYGVLALITVRNVKRMTRGMDNTGARLPGGSHANGTYQDREYYQNYNRNMYPAALSPSRPYDPVYAQRTGESFDGGSSMVTIHPPSEEELINQSFTKLLQRPDMGLNHRTSSSTFRIDWTPGPDENDVDSRGQRRQPTFDGSGRHLAPGQAGRKRSQSANAVRGLLNKATGKQPAHERTKSREERQREIELSRFS